MTYYQILDVAPQATQDQIRTAYRILAQLHHPDRLQQVSPSVREYAGDRLKKINEAYQVLGDPERRARYDATQARAQPASAGYDERAYDEPGGEAGWAGARRRRRPPSAAAAEAAAAYESWAHQEAERYAAAREAERARKAARENREAEARARRAAQEQFPRARRSDSGDELIINFAPGVWTSLARVPAGEFRMGSDEGEDGAAAHETPRHTVYVSEYYIGRYPVTHAQWEAFARATGHGPAARPPAGQDNHPVTGVTWDDAAAFCQWLSRETGQPVRLPTEAEWEKAARGPDGRLYPWGEAWDAARLNWRGEAEAGAGETTPVGRYSPGGDSPFGPADMAGNVWEWCSDWFDTQTYAARGGVARDPAGPETGTGYVARGGAFDSPARHARCAHRNWYYPDDRRANLGFRVAVGAP